MEKMRLLCLPYAGGSAASIYLSWKRKLKEKIEVLPLELAGRGKRLREPLCTSVNEMVDDLIQKSLPVLQDDSRPYAIFGHSMGGLLAYELCNKIQELGLPAPTCLIVSGFHPPDKKIEGNLHQLPLDEFAEVIKKSGNVPPSIFEDRDLYNLFIPILHADYKLVFSYQYKPKATVLNTDLYAFTGKEDYKVYHQRKEWMIHTIGKFQDFVFEGGHFFIRQSEEQVLEKIEEILSTEKPMDKSLPLEKVR
ncbi:thioesterase II family protein [Metabacillus arenae]|uniref:Thioesterase n=1 Tax=Metabacillus arenae TaxID=2771434 RepID=A0A926NFE0_9BACI|nr:alpha/beta fold hydrolase [Metabacillus arenae]MBD1379483.1 thioesterase [Metabacillus arenae]